MYIGLGGAVTFKNARVPVEAASFVPLDRLVLETDAPYMSPVPQRGKRCDSVRIKYTAEKIAEIKGISVDMLLDATEQTPVGFSALNNTKSKEKEALAWSFPRTVPYSISKAWAKKSRAFFKAFGFRHFRPFVPLSENL